MGDELSHVVDYRKGRGFDVNRQMISRGYGDDAYVQTLGYQGEGVSGRDGQGVGIATEYGAKYAGFQSSLSGLDFSEANADVGSIEGLEKRTYIANGINNTGNQPPENVKGFVRNINEELGYQELKTVPGIFYSGRIMIDTLDVIKEMFNSNVYSDQVTDYIVSDLKNSPLKRDEKLNLIGYSGGGQVMMNVAEKLEGKYVVDNMISLGSPIMELTRSNIYATTHLNSYRDVISWFSIFDVRAKNIIYRNVKHSSNNSYLDNNQVLNDVIEIIQNND